MGPPTASATFHAFAVGRRPQVGYGSRVFKASPIPLTGRWLVTLIFVACALLPTPIILMTLPALSRSLQAVLIGVCLLWLIPLYYCTMLGQHWARHLTGLVALGALVVVLACWVPGQAAVSLGLMAVAAAVWLSLTFVPAIRSPVPW